MGAATSHQWLVAAQPAPLYNGWAVWDNYHTQLPLLSLAYPTEFQDIAASLANLYRFGKRDYATQHEPSPTVRTEHTIVVLLDAVRKGYALDLRGIRDSLLKTDAWITRTPIRPWNRRTTPGRWLAS